MAERIPNLRPQYLDDDGAPLSGGKLYSYIAGTTTPLGTYKDVDELQPNTNPIILDGGGRAQVLIAAGFAYKFVLTDLNDVIIWTEDDVVIPTVGGGGGGGGFSPWIVHPITDGQAATDLAAETLDLALYSSGVYDCEIIRGTTIFANGPVAIQNVNGTGRVRVGMLLTDITTGVVFTVSQVGLVVTLRAACSAGPGNGTIKLSRRLVPA